MTIEDLRTAVTLVSFLCFVGLLVWAWSARNRSGFDEAARLPFALEADAPLAQDPSRSDTR